jgi:TolA-binding protein
MKRSARIQGSDETRFPVVAALLAALAVISLTACASITQSLNGGQLSVDREQRIRSLEREIKRQQGLIDELRERNLVLERRERNLQSPKTARIQPVPIPFHPSAAEEITSAPAPAVNLPVPSAIAAVPAPELAVQEPSGDRLLYSKALESYRNHDVQAMQKSVEILLKTYRDSIFADNALFLAGSLALEKNDLERASQYIDRLLRDYPSGNKAVSGLFLKSMIEKRRKKTAEAKKTLEELQRLYPGSPEALRATVELKLLSQTGSPSGGSL